MGSIGPLEIALLLVLALMLFGAKRLPDIGRSLGTGMREFKDSISGITDTHSALPPASPEPELAEAIVSPTHTADPVA